VRADLVAAKPTAAVLEGFLPAASRLGLDVRLLTDRPAAWEAEAAVTQAAVAVINADVRDYRALIHHAEGADAIFTNSDHLQAQVALAAHYLGLPGKDWRACLRAKDKLLMRRHLAAQGIEHVSAIDVSAIDVSAIDVSAIDSSAAVPARFPVVLKPADGVASEDVQLIHDAAELRRKRDEIIASRGPGTRLIAEQYLEGELRTLETLGDGRSRWVLGGFRTRLSEPPYFIEDRLDWDPLPPGGRRAHVEEALDSLGVSFGACHTEFACTTDGPRLIEVNDRLIGDRCEFLLSEILGLDLFELTLRVHLGEPLPAAFPPPRPAHAAASYLRAQRPGVLASTPSPGPLACGDPDVSLHYWPFQEAGSAVTVSHSNRDYLGVLLAIGPCAEAVDRSVARAAGQLVIR
jgi:biotin carboxylase